jgi:DNA-binding Lrp family transcriptional regulator
MNDLIVLNFAEARQPEYKEKKSEGYIEFGQRNDYPSYILELYNKSAKHNAIIKGKVNYINGNGWKAAEDDAVGQAFIDNPNPDESLQDLSKKAEIDIEIFGGAYLEVIWSQFGGQLSSVYHIDFSRCRTNEDNTQFWIKKNWSDRKEEAEILPAFNTSNRQGKQILFIKEYRPGLNAYPLPGYFGALNFIESDIEVSRHILGNAQTGFSASKLITLPNGEPSPEERRNIEGRFTSRFSGADGKKFILSFVNDATRKPIVEDLGASDLTKEDFGRVDSIIQQNLMAGHSITTPTLFGIAEPGQLGTRNQMRDAYEIFKNTYVNDKQQSIEKVFTKLAKEKGATSDLKIIPLEPIGLELSEAAILTVAPREWILEKAGIDITQYQNAPQIADGIDAPQLSSDAVQSPVNDSIKNMTGRQYQQVLRIIRQFGQGKITKEIATTMLKAGLGLTDAEINTMLGVEEEFGQVYSMDETIAMFSEVGSPKENYTIVQSSPLKFEDVTDDVDKQILSILNKQPLTPAQDIAAVLKRSVQDIQERISSLITRKIIEVIKDTGERKLTKPLSEIVDAPVKTTFEIKYSYEWREIVPIGERDTVDQPSRAFCKRLMQIDKFWTRKEIESLSLRLGYSVFDRNGGWWTDPRNPKPAQCRHEWRRNVLIKKTK